MKTENKVLITVIAMLGGLYASFACFNEVNAWIGLLLSVLILGIGTRLIVKFINK